MIRYVIIVFFIVCGFSPLKAQCPTYEDESAKGIIGSFVTTPHWDSIKNANGLSGVEESDVVKLNSRFFNTACNALNIENESSFEKYHVSYYKINNRYLVISVLKQPEDPDLVAFGLSFIDIYDLEFNRLNGYSF